MFFLKLMLTSFVTYVIVHVSNEIVNSFIRKRKDHLL